MKLLTKDLEAKLKEYPLGSQDGKLGNSKVIAKFFNPTEVGTWYIIEGKLSELESIYEIEPTYGNADEILKIFKNNKIDFIGNFWKSYIWNYFQNGVSSIIEPRNMEVLHFIQSFGSIKINIRNKVDSTFF